MTTIMLRGQHTDPAAALHRAIAALRGLGAHPPLAAGIADLLEPIAVDMQEASAHLRMIFAGTPAANRQVFDGTGAMRLDWTAALDLAELVVRQAGGSAGGPA